MRTAGDGWIVRKHRFRNCRWDRRLWSIHIPRSRLARLRDTRWAIDCGARSAHRCGLTRRNERSRNEARLGGCERAFEFPGFVPAYIRPLFCEGKGPFRWVALSGDPHDIEVTDRAVMDLFSDNDRLQKWLRGAREKISFQGLPARICWLGYGERDKAG